jgi:hypothetical protein
MSKQHKLEHRRGAAVGSRKERTRREGRRSQGHPWDFGGREQLLSRPKFPMVERRTSVNRSPCGRRTSL